MPQGKVLGGGSILNAMCWNRGGQDDYDAWAALGNPGWDWDGILPYFIKVDSSHSSSFWLFHTHLQVERDLHTRLLGRDCSGVLDQLQSSCAWHFRTRPSQLPKILLSAV